jgi:Methylamine utilisation protein MauE
VPWVVFTAQLVLAAVLVTAAMGKILQPDDFREAVRASGLPVGVIVSVVPAVELGIGFLLVVLHGVQLTVAFAAALALLTAFTAWIVWVKTRKLRVRCGCFGTGNVEIGYRDVARNVVFIAVAVLGLSLSLSTNDAVGLATVWRIAIALPAALVLMLALALWRVRSHLVLTLDALDRRGDASLTPEGGS